MASSRGDMEHHLLRKSVAKIIMTIVIFAIFVIFAIVIIIAIVIFVMIIITIVGCLRALETARHLLRKSVAAPLTSSCFTHLPPL